jgi:hypothetical protein
MKMGSSGASLPISNIVAKGACPICAALKEFQTNLVGNLQPSACTNFCNLHAWFIANSASAKTAATIFLAAVVDADWNASAPGSSNCDMCERIRIEKEARIKEMAQELDRPALRDWLRGQGMFCVRHGRELTAQLTGSLRKTLEETMMRNTIELSQKLTEFLNHAKAGDHAGGGVLGHAAEFLVAQRGILD